jgi:hypothetical protein
MSGFGRLTMSGFGRLTMSGFGRLTTSASACKQKWTRSFHFTAFSVRMTAGRWREVSLKIVKRERAEGF